MGGSDVFSLKCDDLILELEFYTPRMVRVTRRPEGTPELPVGPSVILTPETPPVTRQDSEKAWRLVGAELTVEIDRASGAVRFLHPDGRPLLAEKDGGTVLTPVSYVSGDTFLVRQSFRLERDESVYGLGQHRNGRLDQRGRQIRLEQINMEIAIPFLHSSKGYGVLWNNAAPTIYADSPQETSFTAEAGEGVDYFFLFGGDCDGVIAEFRKLTGAAPLPPLWLLGYLQSRERYASQYELVDVARRYRKLGVPLDAVIQDWRYWGKVWNAMEFANPAYPDYAAAVRQLHELHVHNLISVWPNFEPGCRPFEEFTRLGGFLDYDGAPPGSRVYDAWNPEMRRKFWELLSEHLGAAGIDGWWLDATEPEHPFPHVMSMFGESDAHDTPTAAGPFRKVCNSYPLYHVQGVAEEQRRARPERRVAILSRSAYPGLQRTGAVCWSGDIDSSWKALREQIPAGLNFSLSGMPYWNSDIGGFVGDREYAGALGEPGFRELYIRWMQFGLLCPMMRAHGTTCPREIWQFGERGEWAFDALEAAIRLRYRLLPYLYALAYEVSSAGGTFLRPLWAEDPADPRLRDCTDELLLGRTLLAAPVVEPMYVQAGKLDLTRTGSRRVLLPAGKWFDFYTGAPAEKEVEAAAPIDRLPLFARAGAILPLAPVADYAGATPWTELELRLFPGADGRFTLYEDAFEGYDYEQGVCSLTEIRWDEAARRLTVGARRGSYPGMPERRTFRVVLPGGESRELVWSGAEVTMNL